MREGWGEAAAGVVIVACLVGFALWLLWTMLPIWHEMMWMMVR